jgi:broad-specificity NMP kinase
VHSHVDESIGNDVEKVHDRLGESIEKKEDVVHSHVDELLQNIFTESWQVI